MSDVKFDLSDHADVMATWLEGQPDIPPGVVNTLRDLAAEVRALRKDRERLDWLEMEMAIEFEDGKYRALFRQNMPITREAIDAALSARGGEDGA